MRNVCGIYGIFSDLIKERSGDNRQNALLLLFSSGAMMSVSTLALGRPEACFQLESGLFKAATMQNQSFLRMLWLPGVAY